MARLPENPDDVRMSLGEHLEELRRRVIYALLGMTVAFLACLWFGKPLVKLMVQPVYDAVYRVEHQLGNRPAGDSGGQTEGGETPGMEPLLVVLTPVELFTTTMKAVFVAAAVVSAPWVLYQFWLFVAAGLYPHERRVIHFLVPLSAVLFLTGCVFSYTVVIKYGLRVLLSFGGLAGEMVRTTIQLSAAIDFVLLMSLVMGAVFQLPLVMLGLSKIGLVRPETYVRQWRYSVAAIFIAAAILTPPDAFTQVAMALPMLVLYWLGVLLARLFARTA